jgi:hypothetical protein
MTQVVDDLTLLAILSDEAEPALLTAVEAGEVWTTGTWYYRLHRAINDPKSTGIFSRIAAELSSERRSELIDALNDPPAEITIPGPRLVVPIMGALRLDPRPNLLTAEAIAVGLLSGGTIRVANESPPLTRGCQTCGIPLTVASPLA